MKKLFLLTIMVSVMFPIIAMAQEAVDGNATIQETHKITTVPKQKNLAIVQKTQGFYIFNDCEPVCEYEIVERLKSSFSMPSHKDYESIKAKFIKKALKEYPDADALVLSLVAGGTDHALIIKFKEGTDKVDWSKAIVNKDQGLLIFSDNEPVMEYEIIDRSKAGMTWSGQYDEVKAKLIKKTLKEFDKEVEGIIIEESSGTCIAIKFK